MNFLKALSYVFGYRFFKKISIIVDRLFSYSLNRGLKKVDGYALFQFPSRVEGTEFIEIGKDFQSGKNLRLQAINVYKKFRFNPEIKIGNNVTINPNCQISAINSIKIGNDVLIASYVFISDHSHGKHDFSDISVKPIERILDSKGGIVIGDNTWIGQGVSILSNVKIGKNVIIGANSVIVKDIPDNAIVVGVPGKVIKFT
ncbi:hypothetical protein [Chryseobacterium sp. JAH]|uniref:hypothetical protein n=1 Tax=Chryseobacterium sp. JAH TaxID=1742858 RepID=UPI000741388E|nr:hypothetical protein [Chryseobacterium sp. JAH]KUJ50596.1 hypothetical protein AR685_14985 [Chryseobacterium sp. JAH]